MTHAPPGPRAVAKGSRAEPPAAPSSPVYYEGLVTRAIAFAVDAALIDLIAILVGVVIGLALSILSIPHQVKTVLLAIAGAAFVLWTVAYFVTFWCTTGQTPGNRLFRIRVCRASDGGPLRPRQALLRFVGMVLAAIPLFAGFLPILIDARRRGLHDMLARSVVVGSPAPRTDATPSAGNADRRPRDPARP